MAKKKSAKKPRTINQQFTSLEKLVRSGFRQTDARSRQVDRQFRLVHLEFRDLRKQMNERFAVMEDVLTDSQPMSMGSWSFMRLWTSK